MTESWLPTATLDTTRARATLLQETRRFFAAKNVLEVQTPALSQFTVTNPNIASLAVPRNGMRKRQRWLHTSPEYHMKRLLAAGWPDIYQICQVFRDDPPARWHSPEFTLVEWYRLDFRLADIVDETLELLGALARAAGSSLAPAVKVPYRTAFRNATGVDPLDAADDDLLALARATLSDADNAHLAQLSKDESCDLLLSTVVARALPTDRYTAVYHYPASQADLARIDPEDSRQAERFEIFLGPVELANGYRELTDPEELAARFEADRRERRRRSIEDIAPDRLLLAAMRHGLPECAGVALGLDRCLALLLGLDSLAGAVAFGSAAATDSGSAPTGR